MGDKNIQTDVFKKTTSLPEFKETPFKEKVIKKVSDNPLFPIGIGATILTVIYGAHNYKNRGNISTSVYLLSLRVKAQGAVVAILTGGVLYSMFNTYVLKKNKD